MSESLKQMLYDQIKHQGSCKLSELHYIAESHGYKQSNAERQLRKLAEEGSISPIKNERKHICGYRYGQFKPSNYYGY